ncbi:hypothetical protein GCM10017667_18900 [Streptomyces filamentosus]|uniref:Uncharacterized protein n=1 Tax=Streptomyces filamentosus TaxID=67294 RepID=A0A919EKN5_STRFL|nr:hypothetical protein GCM10017667_18900 [Streptomyces filamentosus]
MRSPGRDGRQRVRAPLGARARGAGARPGRGRPSDSPRAARPRLPYDLFADLSGDSP